MAYRHPSQKVHKVMIQPINVIFRHLQNRTRVCIWLHEVFDLKIEGIVIGFDEYMNIVLNEAQEVVKKKAQAESRRSVGRILLRGDSVSVIQPILPVDESMVCA